MVVRFLSYIFFIFYFSFSYADTLSDVKRRGYLICGVSTGIYGISYIDNDGIWQGLDVDFCRALSSAIFGSKDRIKFIALTMNSRFLALQSGEIDVLSRNTTWTLSRDTDLKLNFAGIIWYDGQGFMAHKKLNVKTIKDLEGKEICVLTGTTTELNLKDYFEQEKIKYKLSLYSKYNELKVALKTGKCLVYTSDLTALSSLNNDFLDSNDWYILPTLISKEPLGPVVRQGDSRWLNIVRWTLNVLIIAEELRITSSNVDNFNNTNNIEVLRLLGKKGNLGRYLGLSKDFGYKIISQVGNYQEIYERTMFKIGLPRGLNKLWKDGGLLYSPPFR